MNRISRLLCLIAITFTTTTWADIRIYDVEPSIQQELAAALNSVLHNMPAIEDENGNRVQQESSLQVLPNGQILINTNAEIHQQIESILQAIERKRVSMSPTIKLRYWLLHAEASQDARRVENLSMLGPTLDEIEREHGRMNFSVIEYARLVSQSGHHASFSSEKLEIRQKLYNNQRSATGEIHLEDYSSSQQLNLSITIAPGEYVVLSENTASIDNRDGLIFYIVHWPEDS